MPGPKMPPEPPEPIESPVVSDTSEREDEHDPQRDVRGVRAEALLDPPVAGAEHLGDGEGDAADEQTADGGAHPSREREPVEDSSAMP